MTNATIVEAIMERLAALGVRRVFGVPGGDCNLDFIDAGERLGISFVLTRTETPAAIMAAVTAELTGTPGVVMTTRGPGFANAMNGLAYAGLDRAPVLLIADAYEPDLDYVPHQRFDQVAMAAPVLKGSSRLESDDPIGELDELLETAAAQPAGPVYLEVTGKRVRESAPPSRRTATVVSAPEPSAQEYERAVAMLAGAQRPAIVAGLQALEPAAGSALRALVEAWHVPVFSTYKAKGIVPDSSPFALGHYVGGVAEQEALAGADLVVLYGFDPIECPPQVWRYSSPVLELTEHGFDRHLVSSRTTLVGDIAALATRLIAERGVSAWDLDALAKWKMQIRDAARIESGEPISPDDVVAAMIAVAPERLRLTVDAGAHMLPVVHLWSAQQGRDLLISRGLATMGFALPAAVGSALAEPDRPVLCCTGDGGILMCLGEIGTAVQQGCNLAVVIFNDASLTLIAAKQHRRGLDRNGVDFSPTNFAAIAQGLGARGHRVATPEELVPALRDAFSGGVALVDVVIDPRGYDDEIIAIRG